MQTQAVKGVKQSLCNNFHQCVIAMFPALQSFLRSRKHNTTEIIIIMPNNIKLFKKHNLEGQNNTLCVMVN